MEFASAVVMIEPAVFYSNEETKRDNHFMQEVTISAAQCRGEFLGALATLKSYGIEVMHLSNPDPSAPDAIFPNNWFSTHGAAECNEPTLVLYPMKWPSRRVERRPEFISLLRERYSHVIDLTYFEAENLSLESTGSLVFDRKTGYVYMAISERADPRVLEALLTQLNQVAKRPWKPVVFHAADERGRPIYHTNVMLGLTPGLAVVNLSAVIDADEKQALRTALETGRRIVDISHEDMGRMCGNILTLYSPPKRTEVIVMSETCLRSSIQLDREVVYVSIPGIEQVGGGSARCLLGELF